MSRQAGQAGAGVGDRDELLRVVDQLVEVAEVGDRLDRRAGLGGDYEQRLVEGQGVFQLDDRLRVGGVQDQKLQPVGIGERVAEDLETNDDPPMPRTTAWVNPLACVLGELIELGDPLQHGVGYCQPAQAVGDLGGVVLPDRVVLAPHPADDIPVTDSETMCRPASRSWSQFGLPADPAGAHLLDLLLQGGQQGREALLEGLDSLRLQLGADLLEVDLLVGEAGQDLQRLSEVRSDRVLPDFAVVLEGVHRLLGHGVDGVRADQLVDVVGVRVGRVLGPGGGQRARCTLAPAAASFSSGGRRRSAGTAGRRALRWRWRPCPVAASRGSRASTAESTREMKNEATDSRGRWAGRRPCAAPGR